MSEWRDIRTLPDSVLELPRNGVMLWNTCDGIHFLRTFDFMQDEWHRAIEWNREEDLYRDFSHWMPAPDGPEVKTQSRPELTLVS